jgi:hypothetical protein
VSAGLPEKNRSNVHRWQTDHLNIPAVWHDEERSILQRGSLYRLMQHHSINGVVGGRLAFNGCKVDARL